MEILCIFAPLIVVITNTTMTMKHTRTALALLLAAVISTSCDNKEALIAGLQFSKDSLQQVSQQQQGIIDGLAETMEEITLTMDTIAQQERIVLSGVDERGVPLTRRNMRAKLEMLASLIKDQHSRLDSLGKALDGSNATVNRLRGVVNMLTKSLNERTREIDSLRTVLANKDISINNLGTQVASLTETVNTVKTENANHLQTIAQQQQSLNQQDKELHEVYYIIGTKDELTAAGVLTKEGGLFKKKKVNFAGMNKSSLTKGDIRTLKSLTIPSKKARIIGDVPEASYQMTHTDNASYLTISDPSRFWSSNNRVLVIQVK